MLFWIGSFSYVPFDYSILSVSVYLASSKGLRPPCTPESNQISLAKISDSRLNLRFLELMCFHQMPEKTFAFFNFPLKSVKILFFDKEELLIMLHNLLSHEIHISFYSLPPSFKRNIEFWYVSYQNSTFWIQPLFRITRINILLFFTVFNFELWLKRITPTTGIIFDLRPRPKEPGTPLLQF